MAGMMDFAKTLPFAQQDEAPRIGELTSQMALRDPSNAFTTWNSSPYNPDTLVQNKGLSVYDKIRTDDQARGALSFKKMAITSPGFQIHSPDGQEDDWEVTEYVRKQIEKLPGTFERTLHGILSALDYGFSVTEKTYVEDGHRLDLAHLRQKYPHGFEFDVDEFGTLKPDGLLQDKVASGRNIKDRLPISKFIIFSHQMEFSNYYGESDLRTAYRPWWTKDNAYKWMAMLLEKYGIPPIFAMYSPRAFQGRSLIDDVQSVINKIRAGTAAAVPRNEPTDLEFWTPQLAAQIENTFIPAINMYDKHIARAILMPTMIGMTPDENVGSNARAQTHFDGFMMIVTNLQREVEAAINEQLIKQLVDVNFIVDAYPEFKFNPLEEARLDLLEAWGNLVARNVVQRGKQDEAHVREVLKMPPAPESDEELLEPPQEMPLPQDMPPEPDKQAVKQQVQWLSELTAGKWYQIDAGMDGTPNRALTAAEESADVLRLFDVLEDAEVEAGADIQAVLRTSQSRIKRALRGKSEITMTDIESIRAIPNGASLQGVVSDFLKSGWDDGERTATEEVPQLSTNAVSDFTPEDALAYLDNKSITVSGVIDQSITSDIKQRLLTGVAQGRTVSQMISDIDEVFDPFTGPQPYRLEAVVRTNLTDAFNAGRLNRFQRSADYIEGIQFSAILDGRTSEVCRNLDGRVFELGSSELDRLRPPRHHNCRSLLVPIMIDTPVEDSDRITGAEVNDAIEQSGRGF